MINDPTTDVNIWSDDRLGRSIDADFLSTFLRNRTKELSARGERRSYVLNLDAEWGSGKTFFLERLHRQLVQASHLTVYVNAWRDDFADDPLVAVMAAIDVEVRARLDRSPPIVRAWNVVRASGGSIARSVGKGLGYLALDAALTGGAASAIGAVAGTAVADKSAERIATVTTDAIEKALHAKAQSAVSDFLALKSAIDQFRAQLSFFVSTLENHKGLAAPMFVLVDELDRCRPPYAIATLERIKHLFETPQIVFVVATDRSQLVHSIQAVYGQSFSANRYLDRFFDRVYRFEQPVLERYVDHLISTNPIDGSKFSSPWDNEHRRFLIDYFDHCNFDLRTIARIYDLIRTVGTIWNDVVPLELLVLLPLASSTAVKNDGTPSLVQLSRPWKMEGLDTAGTKRDFDVWDLMNDMWSEAQVEKTPGQIAEQNSPRKSRWLIDRQAMEQRMRIGSAGSSRPFKSMISRYPILLNQAGKLQRLSE